MSRLVPNRKLLQLLLRGSLIILESWSPGLSLDPPPPPPR
jgi:hypothetical protein